MIQNARAQGIYRVPKSWGEDLQELERMVERFKEGTTSADRFRAFRVPLGVYEQRECGTFMLRVRLPAGGLLPHQMRKFAEVAENYGNGVLHVTTRQDVQVHRVRLDDIHPALVCLAQAGLCTKGGGGNTVRNITTCHHAGVCPSEVFDVTPCVVAVTEFLLADPLSYQLPRKYKIAFSGCSEDCAAASVNDLGFIAKRRNGREGFAVYAGGGMGAHSRVADLLEEFVSTADVFLVADAVKRMFDKHGDRKNRHKARLRFLVDRIGFAAFRRLYQRELEELRKAAPPVPQLRPLPDPQPTPGASGGPVKGFGQWRVTNVLPQKQDGCYTVQFPLFLGDIEAEALRSLADIVETYGERMLRTTQWQNATIRWVRADQLPGLHGRLTDLGLAGNQSSVLQNMVVCAGASTCRLGICLSRGLAKALTDALTRSELDLGGLGNLKILISGCPNACGRHPIADIGFYGAARRVRGRLVPHYVVQLGGRVVEGKTELARGRQSIPARKSPAFLVEFLQGFQSSEQYPDFYAFLEAQGRQLAEDLAGKYRDLPDFEVDKNFYFDWGAEEMFSLAGRGAGECGAGVFDLIEVDLVSAAEALSGGKYYTAAALAARALLVVRGEQPENDIEAFRLFRKHFIEQGLVETRLEGVIAGGIRSASAPDPETAFDAQAEVVAELVATVKGLYDNMDPSLRFAASAKEPQQAPPPAPAPPIPPDQTQDFRGVVCPLNYVKTKLALEQLQGGQVLSVLLDDEGAQNVPASVSGEGHEVLSVTRQDDHWRILIRKRQ